MERWLQESSVTLSPVRDDMGEGAWGSWPTAVAAAAAFGEDEE